MPFYDNKKSGYECQLVVGYRGLIDLARRSGQIVSIEARIVYEGDTFDLDYSIEGAKLIHKPCLDGEPGKMRLVYGVATLKDGGHQFELMTRAQIDKIKAISQSGKKGFGPWADHYDEMARKTVVKRLAKYLPISVELADAIENDNKAEGIDPSIVVSQPDETTKLNDRLKLAKQNSAAALPDPIDIHPEPQPQPGEIPNEETEAKEAPVEEPELDAAAQTWTSFCTEVNDIAKARNIDPELVDSALKALKMQPMSKGARSGWVLRDKFLSKLSRGAKLASDGTLS